MDLKLQFKYLVGKHLRYESHLDFLNKCYGNRVNLSYVYTISHGYYFGLSFQNRKKENIINVNFIFYCYSIIFSTCEYSPQ